MKKATDNVSGETITISSIAMSQMRFCIIGTSPLVPHAVSAKAAGSLLFPAPKKNAAEKATTMKHEPLEEMNDAAYKFTDQDGAPTRLYMPGACFHSAMAAVAVDMVGAKKAQIGRLTNVPEMKIPIFGVPAMWMTIVRSSDMARTPDVRTLPILSQWACQVPIEFVESLIKEASIANLLAAAGQIIGIGDGRPQKGKLAMGRYRVCSEDDPAYQQVMNSQKNWITAQDEALANPTFFDLETERLYTWFVAEKARRAAAPAQSSRSRGKKSNEAVVIAPAVNGGEAQVEA